MLALCPLAERLGFITEQLAMYTNDTLGGLLNASFGNATEVIISGFALKKRYLRIVQLSLLGSVISNLLLVMGTAFIAGGIHRHTQRFNQQGINVNCSLLLLGTLIVVLPSLLSETGTETRAGTSELGFSRFMSVFMLIMYACYLIFQLVTHKFLFEDGGGDGGKDKDSDAGGGRGADDEAATLIRRSVTPREASSSLGGQASLRRLGSRGRASANGADIEMASASGRRLLDEEAAPEAGPRDNVRTTSGRPASVREEEEGAGAVAQQEGGASGAGDGGGDDDDEDELVLSKTGCFLWLTGVTVLIALLSEWIMDAIEGAARDLKVPMPFLTTILLPIVGNAAEHASAIVFAYKNRIEIALGVAVGSATQVAVLIVPFCVVLAWAMQRPLDLNFNAFEAAVYFSCVLIACMTLMDGTANWLKGVLLLFTYIFVSAGFWWHKDVFLEKEGEQLD